HRPRGVDESVRYIRKLGDVLPDESALGVEFLRLGYRVEDAEIGLRVTSGRSCPLPTAVVRRKVVVIQALRKVALTPTPVDVQVLHQKRSAHHAQSVMHITGVIDLTHRCIDEWISGACLAPRTKVL